MELFPIGDNVIIQAGESETAIALSRVGLVLAETARDKPNNGTIIAVGQGRMNENGQIRPIQLGVGDQVLFTKYGGTEFEFEGAKLLVVSVDDILCKYEMAEDLSKELAFIKETKGMVPTAKA